MSNATENQLKLTALVDARALGAKVDNTTDDSAALQAFLTAAATTGEGVIPPGNYYVNSALTLAGAQQRNVRIQAHGAVIRSGTAVTGSLLTINSGFSPYQVVIEGLTINHLGNANAGAGIEIKQGRNVTLREVTFAVHTTKAGYAAVKLSPLTVGDANTQSFWTVIERCTFRPESGSPPMPDYCIQVQGAANALTVRDCNFSTGTKVIALQTDGVEESLANGCLIEGNWFEGVTTAISIEAKATTGYWPVGLRIIGNRVESTTTFVSMTTGGAAANNHSQPPVLMANYLVAGSVTNYLVNALSAYVQALDYAYYGPVTDVVEMMNGSRRMKFVNSGNNLVLSNASGNTGYDGAHLVLGSFHLWVATTGKLYLKNGVPTTDTDGTIVGTQT